MTDSAGLRVLIARARNSEVWRKVVLEPDELEALLDENEQLRERTDMALDVGHNDDCLFCGFKDRLLLGVE